jgi:hypothetical protein
VLAFVAVLVIDLLLIEMRLGSRIEGLGRSSSGSTLRP